MAFKYLACVALLTIGVASREVRELLIDETSNHFILFECKT